MKVEEYTCEELPQSVEATEEVRSLLRQLGAQGQEALYEESGEAVPSYRKMTPVEYAVYKTLLPQREPIEKYNAGPIPLRVLQIAAHAKDQLTGTLVVWHQGVGKDDPLLTLRPGNEWSSDYYILARWAEELEEFPVLFERCVKQLTENISSDIETAKAEIDGWMRGLENHVRTMLRSGKTDGPSINWFR